MKTSTKLVALVSLALSAAPLATAQISNDVSFNIKANAPAAEVYGELAQTAKSACNDEYKDSVISDVARNVVHQCANTLIESALAQLNRADLTAFHNTPEAEIIVIAAK